MTPVIRSCRQRRAIAALAKNDGQSVKQLRELTEMIDRDGHVCRPGIYRLYPEHRKLAAQMLEP